MKKALSLILILIMLAPILSSCSESSGEGMNFVVALDAEPRCLDPQIALGSPACTVIENCFEGLVRIGEDGRLVNGVAQSYETSADGLTYTFKIRRDASWHLIKGLEEMLGEDYLDSFDTAVTAYDFVFGIGRTLHPATGSPDAERFFCIKNAHEVNKGSLSADKLGVTAIDAKTLEIQLESKNPDFLRLLASSAAMPCNQSFFEATAGKYGLGVDYTLCNGPFYLSKWTEGSQILIRNNIDYSGEKSVKPNAVYFYFNPDHASRAEKLVGEVYDAAALSSSAAATLPEESGIALKETPNTVWGLCFNCEDSALSNAKLRAALCRAFDRTALSVPDGMTGEAKGFVPACCTVGEVSLRETAGEASFAPYDTASASAMWKEGLSQGGLSEVVLTLLCLEEHENIMKRLLQDWQKVMGVSLAATISCVTREELDGRIKSGDYQAAFAPIRTEESSAVSFLESFTSGESRNIFGFSSDIYDELVERVAETGDLAQVAQGCLRAEAQLLQNGVVYPFYTESEFLAFSGTVSGIYANPAGSSICFISAIKTE